MDSETRKVAHAEYMRKWRLENPEKWKGIANKARKKWKANNRDEHREAQRAHRFTIRREILDLLGGQVCVRCGYDKDWRALNIDHIHSDGRTDERCFDGTSNMWAFRNRLRDPEQWKYAMTRYQILCANCNRIKQHEAMEHPGHMPDVPKELNVRRRRLAKPRNYPD